MTEIPIEVSMMALGALLGVIGGLSLVALAAVWMITGDEKWEQH